MQKLKRFMVLKVIPKFELYFLSEIQCEKRNFKIDIFFCNKRTFLQYSARAQMKFGPSTNLSTNKNKGL